MGTYAEVSSGMPEPELVTDYLSQTGEPFVKEPGLGDYTPQVVDPLGTLNLIAKGIGRSVQETISVTGDPARYVGYSFVKLPPVLAPAAKSRALTAEKLRTASRELLRIR